MHATDLPEHFIPGRHRASAEVREILRKLSWVLPAGIEPDAERWTEMGRGFMRGDAPMDRLVDWMFARGMREARAQFERVLDHGLDSVPDADGPLRDFFAIVERPPAWLDRRRLVEGAEVFRRGGTELVYVARDVSLVGGYQASAFNKTLILTGALQKEPSRRFAETLRWALDCSAEHGLERFGPGYRSSLRVRLIHALVRRHVQGLPSWRAEEWGLPINQPDMAATLLGVFTVPLLGARLMGMPQTRRERDAATHLERYVGWLMGVEDQWLAEDDRSALVLLCQLLLSLSNPDETSPQLARPMMLDEPLQRSYPNLAALRGRYERELHLSISRLFLGRGGMRNLGLPPNRLPWYPLLNLPRNLSRHLRSRLTRASQTRAALRGRLAQEAFLARLGG